MNKAKQRTYQIIEKYGLVYEKHWYIDDFNNDKIITKQGYEYLKTMIGIHTIIRIRHISSDHKYVVAWCRGRVWTDNKKPPVENIGEVSPENNSFAYPVSVAKKRAEGRVILEIAGFTEEGFMTEDERNTSEKTKVRRNPSASIDKVNKLLGDNE